VHRSVCPAPGDLLLGGGGIAAAHAGLLALTDYHDHRKLILVIADGQVKGSGNDRSTPNIVRDLMTIEEDMQAAAQPKAYRAVASGTKNVNAAIVYAGSYHCRGRLVPCILVAKCGTSDEEATSEKPGNRGKRDSQLILMNFVQRVLFNDRMTPLDFDLFNKIFWLMGVPPMCWRLC
jgi:chitin synthase